MTDSKWATILYTLIVAMIAAASVCAVIIPLTRMSDNWDKVYQARMKVCATLPTEQRLMCVQPSLAPTYNCLKLVGSTYAMCTVTMSDKKS